jgi:peptidoglycan hydrolase-like protein with peptidoglycan-binding domain
VQRNPAWAVALALGIGAFGAVAVIEAGDPEPAYAVVVKSRGADVRELQRAIGVGVDGVFGSQTERVLERWQRSHGLVADGVAGPSTRAALGLGPGPVLKRRGGQGGARAATAAAMSARYSA